MAELVDKMNFIFLILSIPALIYSYVSFIQKVYSVSTLFIGAVHFADLNLFGKLCFILTYGYKSLIFFIISLILIYICVTT